MEEERQPLLIVIQETFSHLGNLINAYINVETQTAYEVLYMVTKIFYRSNNISLCPFFSSGSTIEPWIHFFKTLLDRPVPADLDSFTEDVLVLEARDKHIVWKTKGAAARVTEKLYHKYGNPQLLVEESFKDFAKTFKDNFAVPLLESHLQTVFRTKTHFVGAKLLNNSISYLSLASKQANTMTVMKPFIDNLLYETIVPLMLITQKDVALFRDDPIEFIRKSSDFEETVFNVKNQVVEFLIRLCRYKSVKKNKRPDYLHKFLDFALSNLVQAGSTNWRIKEAIMFAIGSLLDDIRGFKDLKELMEPMMAQHVLPELQSQQPFLRMRACWMYGEFGHFSFKDQNHVNQSIDLVYRCLNDQDLPVRFQAALCIKKLLDNDGAAAFLKPALKEILHQYLNLMNEIDSEELVSALELIINRYKDDISPFAFQLTEQLVGSYQRLVSVNVDEDNGESALAAVGCVTAIRRILEGCENNSQLILQMENLLYPILAYSLTPEGLDAIEDTVDCISIILTNSE